MADPEWISVREATLRFVVPATSLRKRIDAGKIRSRKEVRKVPNQKLGDGTREITVVYVKDLIAQYHLRPEVIDSALDDELLTDLERLENGVITFELKHPLGNNAGQSAKQILEEKHFGQVGNNDGSPRRITLTGVLEGMLGNAGTAGVVAIIGYLQMKKGGKNHGEAAQPEVESDPPLLEQDPPEPSREFKTNRVAHRAGWIPFLLFIGVAGVGGILGLAVVNWPRLPTSNQPEIPTPIAGPISVMPRANIENGFSPVDYTYSNGDTETTNSSFTVGNAGSEPFELARVELRVDSKPGSNSRQNLRVVPLTRTMAFEEFSAIDGDVLLSLELNERPVPKGANYVFKTVANNYPAHVVWGYFTHNANGAAAIRFTGRIVLITTSGVEVASEPINFIVPHSKDAIP